MQYEIKMVEKKMIIPIMYFFIIIILILPSVLAWWDTSYAYRRDVVNETTSDIAVAVNGTSGFGGNIIWINPSQLDNISLYYNDTNTYAIANDTIEAYYETEGGGLNNSITSIYSSNAQAVWHFGINGSAEDSTSNNNDGIVNGTTWVSSGMYGGAYTFDGVDDWIDVNGLDTFSSSTFSYSFWAKYDSPTGVMVTTRNGMAIISSTLGVRFYTFDNRDGDSPAHYCREAHAPTPVANTWYHYVYTANGFTLKIYLDGEEMTGLTCGTDSPTGDYAYAEIGANGKSDGAHTLFYNGTIDEIKIYNRVLTPIEIQELYNNSQNLNMQLGNEETLNAAPNTTTPIITPSTAYTDDDLTCNTTVTDDDGDNTTVYFKWYKNEVNIVNDSFADQVNGTAVTDILGSGNFSGGDDIICSVRAYDETSYSDWLNSTVRTISLSGTTQENINASASLTVGPTITSVTPGGPYDPTENDVTSISISFIANDVDGVADLNDTSAQVSVSKGATTRTNTSCSVLDLNSTGANYTCGIDMQYYDDAGTWTVNVSVKDNGTELAYNDTETFTYNSLKAMQLLNITLAFGNISIGAGTTSHDINTKNTGNVQFDVNMTGANLVNGSYTIPANDMNWDIDSDPSDGTNVTTTSQQVLAGLSGSDIDKLWFYIFTNEVLPSLSYGGVFNFNAI